MKYIYFSLTIILLAACAPRKKVVYFQTDLPAESKSNYTPTLKKDDLLSVVVTSNDPESTIPFNLPDTRMNTNSGYTTGSTERVGYLIDENGNVNMPILGSVQVAGLTRVEATELLQNKLEVYLKNPIVNIQILNFKITILGDVDKPGTYKIPNERMTILEALGLSGDNNITAYRKNLLVIRDNDGKKEQYRIDLTDSESIFLSPAYYLEQNDVIYVEPNMSKRSSGAFWRTSGAIFISIVGVVISTINSFVK